MINGVMKNKDRIEPKLWYRLFYEKKELKFDSVQLPKVKKTFK